MVAPNSTSSTLLPGIGPSTLYTRTPHCLPGALATNLHQPHPVIGPPPLSTHASCRPCSAQTIHHPSSTAAKLGPTPSSCRLCTAPTTTSRVAAVLGSDPLRYLSTRTRQIRGRGHPRRPPERTHQYPQPHITACKAKNCPGRGLASGAHCSGGGRIGTCCVDLGQPIE
jgi:hypothetical protein